MKKLTLETGEIIHVEEHAFNKFKKSIENQDVDGIVKHNIEMLVSCPEFIEGFVKLVKDWKYQKTLLNSANKGKSDRLPQDLETIEE